MIKKTAGMIMFAKNNKYDLKQEQEGFFKRNLPIIVAFVLPVLMLSVIFICNEVYPFGEQMFMRSDSYHQYLPFMRAFQRAIQEGKSLSYIWEIGLGTNFASTYAYYLASPLNWIIALFPSSQVMTVMDIFIVLKCGLMSSTFTYYLTKKFGKKTMIASLFGIFYAMSSYMAAFSWNLMWLDCLVLLPLVMLGLERLVKEGKVVLYTITLAVTVLSNYYIGIIICIFLVVYYIYLVICEGRPNMLIRRSPKDVLMSLLRFFWYSVLAGCMSMLVVLPAIMALFGTASGSFSFPESLKIYNNMLEVLSKGAILTEPAVFKGYFPNIYCTVAAFILIPYFWINKKIDIVKKAGMTVLLIFFLLSFDANILTYIWHGFHFPNSLPCRQSFIYIALVLVMCYEAMLHIREAKKLQIIIIAILGIGANVLFYFLFKDSEFTLLAGAVTAAGIVIYAIAYMFMRSKKAKYIVSLVLLFVLCIAECVANTAYTGYSTANRTTYLRDNEAITDLIDSIDYEDFYRVEKNDHRTKNDGTWLDYKSASIFSSTTLDGVTQFYDNFGMQSSMNAFSYYGNTPLTTMILGVKYELYKSKTDDALKTLYGSETYDIDRTMYLYENKYALGLGFAVKEDSDEAMEVSDTNPFISQNEFAEESCGISGLFEIQEKESGVKPSGTFEKSGRGFLFVSKKIGAADVTVKRNGETVLSDNYGSLENSQIIDLGDVEAGDTFTIESSSSEFEGTSFEVIPAVMDYDVLDDIYEALSDDMLKITEFDEGHVAGTIDLKEGEELLTTIPCDEGWVVEVDGEEVETEKYLGAFIAVKADPGIHYVEFKFKVPGRISGAIICLAGIVLFLLSLIPNKINRRKMYRRFAKKTKEAREKERERKLKKEKEEKEKKEKEEQEKLREENKTDAEENIPEEDIDAEGEDAAAGDENTKEVVSENASEFEKSETGIEYADNKNSAEDIKNPDDENADSQN